MDCRRHGIHMGEADRSVISRRKYGMRTHFENILAYKRGANQVMMDPIIVPDKRGRTADQPPIAATGGSFDVHEWSGSGAGYLHVHHADDEAWHVLEGTLTFRFKDKQIEATAGTTVFVPAGVPH